MQANAALDPEDVCTVCTAAFNMMTNRKHRCRQCERVVCGACSPSVGAEHSHMLQFDTAERVCSSCVRDLRLKLLRRRPSWFPAAGCVLAATDGATVTYSNRAWWQENGNRDPPPPLEDAATRAMYAVRSPQPRVLIRHSSWYWGVFRGHNVII